MASLPTKNLPGLGGPEIHLFSKISLFMIVAELIANSIATHKMEMEEVLINSIRMCFIVFKLNLISKFQPHHYVYK